MDSTSSSEFESDSDPEPIQNTSSILFFKKAPNDESRLAKNSIIYKKNNLEKGLTKDKRVTVQQVLDKRTYIRLKRLHGRGIFDFIYGVISTGKEANVYEAEGTLLSKKHRIAIKVYKTSILIFKDRSRYIEGEFRFRRSYVGTKNPRKMVSQWAEKEFRNLRRISLSGVYCPSPIALKDHILVMELIQDPLMNAAPKLKDLGLLPLDEWQSIYAQVISIMRILYQESKLIHADFSSYNLLYSDYKVIVIDVSQAVENDHPNAMYFLKRDCENITTFFTSIQYHTLNNVPNYDENPAHTEIPNDLSDNTEVDQLDGRQNTDHTHYTESPKNIFVDCDDMKFNMLTSFQLFNFITMDLDADLGFKSGDLCDEKVNEEDVDWYVSKMVYTSKNAKSDHLKETILNKRAYYKGFYRHVHMLLVERHHSLFIDEKYESNNYISHEACWNSLKLINISGLTVDALDRLEREDNLPDLKLNGKKSNELDGEGPESDTNGLDTRSDLDSDGSYEDFDDENQLNSADVKDPKDIIKFDGKIPDGIPAKDWKRMVKEMNRERRKHKIPKHIKKSFKQKHT